MAYLVRILGILGVICFLSIAVFVISPSEFHDRLGNVMTVLLTITAYTLVVGDNLPPLGYLTFLDYFTLIAYAFSSLEVVQITLIAVLDPEDGLGSSTFCGYLDLCLLVCILGGISIYVYCRVLPKERNKVPQAKVAGKKTKVRSGEGGPDGNADGRITYMHALADGNKHLTSTSVH